MKWMFFFISMLWADLIESQVYFEEALQAETAGDLQGALFYLEEGLASNELEIPIREKLTQYYLLFDLAEDLAANQGILDSLRKIEEPDLETADAPDELMHSIDGDVAWEYSYKKWSFAEDSSTSKYLDKTWETSLAWNVFSEIFFQSMGVGLTYEKGEVENYLDSITGQRETQTFGFNANYFLSYKRFQMGMGADWGRTSEEDLDTEVTDNSNLATYFATMGYEFYQAETWSASLGIMGTYMEEYLWLAGGELEFALKLAKHKFSLTSEYSYLNSLSAYRNIEEIEMDNVGNYQAIDSQNFFHNYHQYNLELQWRYDITKDFKINSSVYGEIVEYSDPDLAFIDEYGYSYALVCKVDDRYFGSNSSVTNSPTACPEDRAQANASSPLLADSTLSENNYQEVEATTTAVNPSSLTLGLELEAKYNIWKTLNIDLEFEREVTLKNLGTELLSNSQHGNSYNKFTLEVSYGF
jgi:hypothetical protein